MNDYSKWLLDWFNKRVPHVHLSTEDNYFNAGAIDSLGIMELIEDMEQHFLIRFTQDDFQDRRFASIAGLTAIVSEKIEKKQ